MTQVTAQLASANGDDIKALATYVAAQMGVTEGDDAGGAPAPAVTQASTTPRPPLTSGDSLAVPAMAEAADDPGGAIYAAACSSCHESGRIQPYGGLDFHDSTAIHADNPQNIINMILYGLPATDSRKAGMMPGFAGALDQEQLVALLGYLRSNFTDKPAWPDVATQVADTMSGKTAVKTYSADGVIRSPGSVNARTAP
jgi:mono/diheme cytochrome c family protein